MKIDNLRTDLSPQSAVPPKCEIDERVDLKPSGCRKCGNETRAYTTFMTQDFCDECIKIVTKLEAMHLAFNEPYEPCQCGDHK